MNSVLIRPSILVRRFWQTRALILEPTQRWTHATPSSKIAYAERTAESVTTTPLDLTFEDGKTAYKSKTSWEVLRGYLVFQLCSINFIVDNQKMLLNLSRRLLGRTLFTGLMKNTFFGHFVAGVDEREVKSKVDNMYKHGVRSILCYSAEEDLKTEKANVKWDDTSSQSDVVTKRKLYHHQEVAFEKNTQAFLACLEAIDNLTNGTGRGALKITSLLRPELLLKFSSFIKLFEQAKQPKDALSWKNLCSRDEGWWMKLIDEGQSHVKPEMKVEFDSTEINELRNMVSRVDDIFKLALDKNIIIFVDAEQTYFQDAIRRLAIELMRNFNKNNYIVFNTYQNYLKGTFDKLVQDLEIAREEGFCFGAKLVKGAYMEQERERANAMGYEDPVNVDLDATNEMYMRSLSYCLSEIKARSVGRLHVTVASHSESTVKFAVEKMAELKMLPDDGVVSFGQLLGMCDFISFYLGSIGYPVYKIVPYGPVEEVLPYLSRRVIENRGIFDKVKKEKRLLLNELKRRVKSSLLLTI